MRSDTSSSTEKDNFIDYIPTTDYNFQSFLESMHGALESVTLQENLEIFIMGDFNIDLIELLNQTASILLDDSQGLGFSQ